MAGRLDWYHNDKFGLFIHWGPYSIAGTEASWPIMAPDLAEGMFHNRVHISEAEYTALPQRFNPQHFDPDEWVRIAKAAGMRYMVFTAKHHDGFCMFDAPGTDYTIMNTPYGRDICLELAQACARGGLRLGFYYSPPDMHHPGYRDTHQPTVHNWTGEPNRPDWITYLDYMESHLRKLLTDYGEVCLIWFDGLANHNKYEPARFHRLIHELSPNTLINDRLGDGYDFITPEQFIPKNGIPARTGKPPAGVDPGGDAFFRTVEFLYKVPLAKGWIGKQMDRYAEGKLELTPVHQERYPAPDRFQPWETCMTMGNTWAYNPHDDGWKSSGELLRNLVRVASRGGNFLLNVGPDGDGRFPHQAVERLDTIGRWVQKNAEALFGTTYTPLAGGGWGGSTRKDSRVYLHLFAPLSDDKLVFPAFPGSIKQALLLNGEVVDFVQNEGQLELHPNLISAAEGVSVVALEIDPQEPGWTDYSQPVVTTQAPWEYIRHQAFSSALINAILNGMIAFFSYQGRQVIPYDEMAIDILITVAIIAFINAWLAAGSARTALIKGDIRQEWVGKFRWRLPQSSAVLGLLTMLVCTGLFGGVVMDGLLFVFAPMGVPQWVYIVLKTMYTGVSAGLAVAMAVLAVLRFMPEKENR
ncbi:MAG: alpha-L-fucosidase [Anaerolineae bacterium]|nr:alpha-L-fucosidase [Anaerolineae bacterium]